MIKFCSCVVVCAFLNLSACGRAQQPAVNDATSYAFHSLQIGGGGFITGVLFHPTVKGLVYLRTDIGGAYRWEDAANRWTSLSEWVPMASANLLGIESMAVDPSHPDDLYLAAGTYTQPGIPNGALLRSHDRGAHFEIINLPFQLGGNEPARFAGERLAIDPSSSGTLYLGTRNDGLWRSKDSGSTWQSVTSFPSKGEHGLGVMFVLPVPATVHGKHLIYAGVADRAQSLYVSDDTGESWNPVADVPKGSFPYRAAVGADGALYVTYGNNAGPNGVTAGAVYRRNSNGNWTDITPAKPAAGETGWGYAGLALDAEHPRTVMVTTLDRWRSGDTIFRSTDDGQHWESLKEAAVMDSSHSPFLRDDHGATPFGHWIAALGIDPFQPEHVMYGTGATLWQTHDLLQADQHKPTHWSVDTQGMEETAVLALLKPKGGALFAALGDIGCFRAVNTEAGVEAKPFDGLALSNCDSIAAAPGNPQIMAAVGRTWGPPHHGGYSDDGGLHWTPFTSQPQDATNGGRVAITADGSTIFWTTHAGSFVTFDRGKSWSDVMLKPRLELLIDPRSPTAALVLDSKAGDIYAVTWSALSPDKPLPSVQVKEVSHLQPGLHLASDPSALDGLWAFGNTGLFQLDPTTREPRKLPTVQAAYTLGFGKGEGMTSTIFLVGQIAAIKDVYRSTDQGQHWTRITDDQHGFGWTTVVSGDPEVFGKVYLGTNGLGVIVGEPSPVQKPH